MRVFTSALLVATVAQCFQIPVNLFLPALHPHYLSVDRATWPVDLEKYMDQKVVRITADDDTRRFLRENKFKIWSHSALQKTVDVQVTERDHAALIAHLKADPEVVVRDLAQAVFETYPVEMTGNYNEYAQMSLQEVQDADDVHAASEVFFKLYRPLLSIDAWLDMLQQTYPKLVTMETIGQTYEGRDFKVVHISVPDDDVEHKDRKTIVVTGGVHAREWISVSSTLYCIYEMLNHYEENPDTWKELAKLDFLFIPVLNPDGYEYSWGTDRLWRKNRQHVTGGDDSVCLGIDIDHLFDYHWTPSSDDACGEEYSGEGPFEAYELRIWDTYLNTTNEDHRIWGYIDLHLYSQEILYPYAYLCNETPRDEENLIELAYGISKAIRLTSGKYYAVLPACIDRDSDLIPDLGSGLALDYMYHHRAYWAFQMKLRDGGSHGFLLPDKYIQPVGEEVAAGIKYFCRFILSDDR